MSNSKNVRAPLELVLGENRYTVKPPTVGQLWDVEELKSSLSNGKYGILMTHKTFWSEYSLDNIDMFAYFSVFVPKLIEDIKANSWRDLDPFDLQELREVYKKDFIPWLGIFTKALQVNNDEKSNG